MEQSFIIEGSNGGPLGDVDDVLEAMKSCFREVRHELRTQDRPSHNINLTDRLLDRNHEMTSAVLNRVFYGRPLKYPQCEAYLFGPDGFAVFHAGSPVRRIVLTIWVPPGEQDKIKGLLADTGWSARKRNWKDWFRRT